MVSPYKEPSEEPWGPCFQPSHDPYTPSLCKRLCSVSCFTVLHESLPKVSEQQGCVYYREGVWAWDESMNNGVLHQHFCLIFTSKYMCNLNMAPLMSKSIGTQGVNVWFGGDLLTSPNCCVLLLRCFFQQLLLVCLVFYLPSCLQEMKCWGNSLKTQGIQVVHRDSLWIRMPTTTEE